MRTFGEREGAVVRGHETSRGIEAGRRTGPRHRVGVPAPQEKQGLRGDSDDSVQAAQVVRPAGGETRGSWLARGVPCLDVQTGIRRCGFVTACVRIPAARPPAGWLPL